MVHSEKFWFHSIPPVLPSAHSLAVHTTSIYCSHKQKQIWKFILPFTKQKALHCGHYAKLCFSTEPFALGPSQSTTEKISSFEFQLHSVSLWGPTIVYLFIFERLLINSFIYIFWLCWTACGILVPQPGSNPRPLHWKHGALKFLNIGLPGKSYHSLINHSPPMEMACFSSCYAVCAKSLQLCLTLCPPAL